MGQVGNLHQAKRPHQPYQALALPFIPAPAPINQQETNFLLEGVRLGLSQKKTPQDSTLTYSPRGLTFSDGPRMTPYHMKLCVGYALKPLNHTKHDTHRYEAYA